MADHRNEEATSRTLPGNTKNTHNKPPELNGDVDLKCFEARQYKFMDYYVLSGMHKSSRKFQLANLRS